MEKTEAIMEILGIDKSVEEVENTEEGYKLYKKVKEIKKELEKKRKDYREKVFELVEKETEPDGKGHYTREFEDGLGFQKQARVSVNLNEDKVKEYAKENNMEDELLYEEKEIDEDKEEEIIEVLEEEYPEGLNTITKVDEIELETLVNEEVIDYSDFEEMVDKKVNYALIDKSK